MLSEMFVCDTTTEIVRKAHFVQYTHVVVRTARTTRGYDEICYYELTIFVIVSHTFHSSATELSNAATSAVAVAVCLPSCTITAMTVTATTTTTTTITSSTIGVHATVAAVGCFDYATTVDAIGCSGSGSASGGTIERFALRLPVLHESIDEQNDDEDDNGGACNGNQTRNCDTATTTGHDVHTKAHDDDYEEDEYDEDVYEDSDGDDDDDNEDNGNMHAALHMQMRLETIEQNVETLLK